MRVTRGLVALVACGLLATGVSACSSGSGDPKASASGGSDSASPSAEPSNYLKVPKGVQLTAQGSALKVGDTASVAWQLDAKRIAALDVTVTKLRQVPISRLSSWVLDAKSKKSTPYFVSAKIKNVGRSNLGGATVPLYGAVGENSLVSASSFESAFKPCASKPLPKKFKTGKKVTRCWVYLAPDRGKLKNVTFYTGPGFDPITWKGKVVKQKAKKPKNKKKAKQGTN
jgi:hypothetical protein